MVDDRAAESQNGVPDFEFESDVEAIVEDDEADSDDARHYLQDPNNLADNARDADEREQDDVLELDQTELEELGLTLDDPHQPESE
jgi:hypothetical protein